MSWRKAKIGDFIKRSKIPIDIQDNQEYKRVTIRINHNGISIRDVEKGKKIGTKKQFILQSGQFVLSKIDARYGAFGIAPNEVEGAIITGNFWAYDVDFSQVNIEWFNQFTNSPQFYELCERASSGITHRKYLSESFFLNYEIDLPSVDVQQTLIEEVKKLKAEGLNLSSELNTQLSYLKQLRQAFLQEAMQGKLCLTELVGANAETGQQLLEKIKAEKAQLIKDKKLKKEKELPPIKPEEIPFEIPENWVWCRLGELLMFSEAGKSYKCIETPIARCEWGVIKVSAVSWDDFLEDKNKLYSVDKPDDISAQIHEGDFLISRANTSELVGKSVVVKSISKNLLLSDKTIRFKFSNFISPDYINLCNNSKHARVYYAKMGTGSSPSMKNITREHMKCLLIPLPPFKEQNLIVARIELLNQTCNELEESIKQSQVQNEQLLQQVLKEALEPKLNYKTILA